MRRIDIQRGNIHLVELDPARPDEANKTRPAIIVSNNAANSTTGTLGRGVVTVVPVTSNVTKVLPFQILLRAGTAGLTMDSKAQAEQVRSVSASRIGRRLGQLDQDATAALDTALRLHLGL